MSDEDKLILIARFLSNECDEAERKQVQEWLRTDANLRQEINRMQEVWSVEKSIIPSERVDRLWHAIKPKLTTAGSEKEMTPEVSSPPRLRNISAYAYRTIKYAAVLFMIILATYFFVNGFLHYMPSFKENQYQTLFVENGQRVKVTLSDGTKITLDSGSELKYPSQFGKKQRMVYLKGEAYFEVTHDAKRPFHVTANHASIHVLGTKFNVRAWQEDPAVAVVVVDGRVAFNSAAETTESSVVVTGGKASKVLPGNKPSIPVEVNVQQHLAWMDNEIRMNDADVKAVLAQLKRWYNYKFEVDDSLLLDQRVTVHIKKTNIADVLQLISMLTDTEISKEGQTIKIREKIH